MMLRQEPNKEAAQRDKRLVVVNIKAITLMRYIRKALEDKTFVKA